MFQNGTTYIALKPIKNHYRNSQNHIKIREEPLTSIQSTQQDTSPPGQQQKKRLIPPLPPTRYRI